MPTFPAAIDAGAQSGAMLFTPTFQNLGTHVSDVDADGYWVATKAGPVVIVQGRCDVDISADLANEGFKILMPASLDFLFASISGFGLVLNAVAKGLTVASPGKTAEYDRATRLLVVTFDSWDGGGVVADVKVDFTICFLCDGIAQP